MSADLKGKSVLFACAGMTYSLGITVGASELPLNQSQTFEQPAEATRIKGDDGEVRSIAVTNKRKRYKLTVIPAGTALSDVKSLLDKFLTLKAGDAVTIADPDSAITDATNSAKFFVDPENGPQMTRTVDGAASIEITLEQYVANDLSTTAS